MQVVDEDAVSGHAVHLSQNRCGLPRTEVVKKEGGDRHVDVIVRQVQRHRVAHLYASPSAHARGQRFVQVGVGVRHRARIQVDAGRLQAACLRVPEPDQVDQAVAAAGANVQHRETRPPPEERSQQATRRCIAAEELIRESKIAQRAVQAGIHNRQIVHDLIDVDALAKVGQEGRNGCLEGLGRGPEILVACILTKG